MLSVTYSNGRITTEIKGAVNAGTYTYICTGYVGETALKAVPPKVTVSATTPKVKLASTTFKLNTNLAGQESVSTKVTVSTGYTMVGFDTTSKNFEYKDGYLITTLGKEDVGGTYTLYPILKPNGSKKAETMATGIKVTTYTGDVTATVSAKGKLDTLNPDSAITCMVELKNCAGTVSKVELSGQDGKLFLASVDETGKVIVTRSTPALLTPGKSYTVYLDVTPENNTENVKPIQTKLTVKVKS